MAIFPGAVSTDSDLYIAVNILSTVLTDNPLTIGATTVNVSSTTGFPTVGFISIDAEIIKYTGKTGTSFTGCTRGADGTSAASHLLNAQVDHNVIAAHHNVLKDEIIALESFVQTHIGLTTAVTAAEFERLSGVTSAIQTQLNAKAPLASPTFTGVVTFPSPFTLGATSVTASGAEINFLVGVTSLIQTQLNGKEPTIITLSIAKGGTNSGTALNNNRILKSLTGAIVEAAAITANRALISDANGIPTQSTVTNTELAFVSGVTSAIQTQLDAKVNDTGDTMTGDLDMSGNDVRRVATLNDTFLSGFRNRVVNGDFEFDQRNAGLNVVTINNSSIRALDCWSGEAPAADGVFTIAQNTTVPTGFRNALRVTVTTADASVGAAQDYDVRTAIEGLSVRDFLLGTASATQITISFWVRSSQTGTFGFGIQNSGFSRSYVAQYTINSANTYEYKTVTLTGDTTGTWLTDTGAGLRLLFDMGSGTSVEGTANSWQAGNFFRASGNTRLISTNTATWYLTGLQVEIGGTATAFEYLSGQVGLARVQRYFQKSYLPTIALATTNSQGAERFRSNGTGHQHMVPFKVNMRVSPTVTFYNYSTGGTGTWFDNSATANRTVSNALASDRALCGELTGAVDLNEMLGHWAATAEL